MNKINTQGWKEFYLTELFDIRGSVTTSKKDLAFTTNGYPYVTTAATNNGICGYTSKYTEEGNVITIDSAVLGYAFYQKENFTASDHVEKLVPKFDMNENIALYITSILNKTSKLYEYAYNKKRSQTALREEKIKLPVTKKGALDYEYIETYIENIKFKTSNRISNLKQVNSIKFMKCNLLWKKFHLYDKCLFDIDMGTKLDKSKMTELNPTINFVGRANSNNGITACVDKIMNIKPYKAGNITLSLGGEYLGSCFIQPKDFYTSQNVVVLIPKWKMPYEVKMFITAIIFKESRTYYKAFVNELNRHIKTDFSFYLPINKKGEPDWEYMENYMKEIEKQAKNKLTKLQTVLQPYSI